MRVSKFNRSNAGSASQHRAAPLQKYSEPASPWLQPRGDQAPKPFKPTIPRDRFSLAEAEASVEHIHREQAGILSLYGFHKPELLKGAHAILAGGTSGLGKALAVALLNAIGPEGKLFVISRDPRGSLQHFSGQALENFAKADASRGQFFWDNEGIGVDDASFARLGNFFDTHQLSLTVDFYINCVAFAKPGMYPGKPKIYCPDVSKDGQFFEWEIDAVTEQDVVANRKIMGEVASGFAERLRQLNFSVQQEIYPAWRGADNELSRDPQSTHYGEEGAYSGALAEPKIFLKKYVQQRHAMLELVTDENPGRSSLFYYPTMHTYALDQIPGATLTHAIFRKLMDDSKNPLHRYVSIAELAMQTLSLFARPQLGNVGFGPEVLLDANERFLEKIFRQVHRNLSSDPESNFYWKHWVSAEFLKSHGQG